MQKFLTALLWVGGLMAIAYLIRKAIVDAITISSEGQLAVARAGHDHKERMADKFIRYHRQAHGVHRVISIMVISGLKPKLKPQ